MPLAFRGSEKVACGHPGASIFWGESRYKPAATAIGCRPLPLAVTRRCNVMMCLTPGCSLVCYGPMRTPDKGKETVHLTEAQFVALSAQATALSFRLGRIASPEASFTDYLLS